MSVRWLLLLTLTIYVWEGVRRLPMVAHSASSMQEALKLAPTIILSDAAGITILNLLSQNSFLHLWAVLVAQVISSQNDPAEQLESALKAITVSL